MEITVKVADLLKIEEEKKEMIAKLDQAQYTIDEYEKMLELAHRFILRNNNEEDYISELAEKVNKSNLSYEMFLAVRDNFEIIGE